MSGCSRSDERHRGAFWASLVATLLVLASMTVTLKKFGHSGSADLLHLLGWLSLILAMCLLSVWKNRARGKADKPGRTLAPEFPFQTPQ